MLGRWCDQRHRARGLCTQHYDRLRYWGDPLAGMYPMPTICQGIEREKVGPGSLFLIPVRTGAGLAGEQFHPPLRQAGGGRRLLLFPFAGPPQLSHPTQTTRSPSWDDSGNACHPVGVLDALLG